MQPQYNNLRNRLFTRLFGERPKIDFWIFQTSEVNGSLFSDLIRPMTA